MSGFNMPPGVGVHDIPGNRPSDLAWEAILAKVPAVCPGCGFPCWAEPGEPDGEFGLATHVAVRGDDPAHGVAIVCVRENVTASRKPGRGRVAHPDPTECETVLTEQRCTCRACEPPERG